AATIDRSQLTAHAKPMLLGDIAFGDRDEAGEARLSRQQIVERVIRPPLADVMANRENLAFRIKQEGKIHLVDDLRRLLRELAEARGQRLRRFRSLFHGAGKLID